MLARIFLNAPQMSDQDASLGGTGTGSTTISTKNLRSRTPDTDWDSLSARSQQIRLAIGEEMIFGYSPREIAAKLKQSTSWVEERLTWLHSEISLQTGFLPLTDDEFETLTESIREFGIQSPIVLGDYGIIDGRHRLDAAKRLGLPDVPVVFVEGKTEDEEHDLSVSLNIARRHLTAEQKKIVARAELRRDMNRSDRSIGRLCGLDGKTVATIRAEIRAEEMAWKNPPTDEHVEATRDLVYPEPKKSQVRNFRTSDGEMEMRKGSDGKTYPVLVTPPKDAAPKSTQTKAGFLGYSTCPHGESCALYFEKGNYRLESVRD